MERKLIGFLSVSIFFVIFVCLIDGAPSSIPVDDDSSSEGVVDAASLSEAEKAFSEEGDVVLVAGEGTLKESLIPASTVTTEDDLSSEDIIDTASHSEAVETEELPIGADAVPVATEGILKQPLIPVDTASTASSHKQLRIAVFLWRGETDAERSFYQKLKELGHDVVYDVFDTHQSLKEAFNILDNKFDAKRYHYVYTFGSQLTLILKRHLRNEVPLIFNAVSFPEETGLVVGLEQTRENITGFRLNITGANASGVSAVSDIKVQLEHARMLFPFERLCVWINPQDLGSVESLKQIESLGSEFQLQVFSYKITNADALQNALKLLREGNFPIKCDAIWIPSASLFVEKAEMIGQTLPDLKIPVIAESQILTEQGALISTAPDHTQTGIRLAEIVDQNRKGRDLQFIPVKCPEPGVHINKTMLRKLSISIADKPDDFLKRIHYVQTVAPVEETEKSSAVVDVETFS
ncbi:MAG: hypothetical protein LBD40_03245 [Puniceicoccales bacterium]|jgi:ABC-type uncharacterized transport system substrate-binding protein|nr:hypothetical protein [Puniceicoccales bacterium]